MKKIVSLVTVTFCVTIAFALVGCSEASSSSNSSAASTSDKASEKTATEQGASSKAATGQQAEVANPWVDCEDLATAEKAAGFKITLPIDPIPGDMYRAIPGELIEVTSTIGGSTIMRKGVGDDDISGDYNCYPLSAEEDGFSLEGTSEEDIYLATWTKGGYSYSISVGDPISIADMVSMAKAMS